MSLELAKGNATALKDLAAEKKKRASGCGQDAQRAGQGGQYACALRDDKSWKESIADSATFAELLALAHSKGQFLSTWIQSQRRENDARGCPGLTSVRCSGQTCVA